MKKKKSISWRTLYGYKLIEIKRRLNTYNTIILRLHEKGQLLDYLNNNWRFSKQKCFGIPVLLPYTNNGLLNKNKPKALKEAEYKCEKCGKNAYLVHHKDFTKSNHKLSNLQALCYSCHIKLHVKERKSLKYTKK